LGWAKYKDGPTRVEDPNGLTQTQGTEKLAQANDRDGSIRAKGRDRST